MFKRNLPLCLLSALFLLTAPLLFSQDKPSDAFLGTWALDLAYENNKAGWLEVTRDQAYLDASLLWRWGSVYPVDFAFTRDDELVLVHGEDVVMEKDAAGNAIRTRHPVYYLTMKIVSEGVLEGEAVFPNRNGDGCNSVRFSGKKRPPYGKVPKLKKVKYGEPVKLFNGKNMDGWILSGKGAKNGWEVIDGSLVNNPVQEEGKAHVYYGNIRTVDTFEDFRLSLEINVPEGSNSGVYLRGIYEVQVMDSYGKEPDSHNMGALYSRITPSEAAEKPAGEWQSMDIVLYKRYLTVVLNGTKIIDHQPVNGVTGGALTSDECLPGPILFQGDHGKVSYRNIVLTPILN